MSEVENAVRQITFLTKAFPEKAFRTITANRGEAIPYLREAVEYAICKREELEDGYQLHFYAMFLLGEFQDRESFAPIMEMASLPQNELAYLIGDAVTEGLRDILYNTYNGDLDLLKKSIQNRDIDEFARSSMLDVMGQLYLDGSLAESEWKGFLKGIVYDGKEYDYIYNAVEEVLCKCHFADMLSEIRYMFDRNILDESIMGKYDSCVDDMFKYREHGKRFCKASINAAETLRHWAMFTENADSHKGGISEKNFDNMFRKIEREWDTPAKKVKIGRNDPCPCGSGKKYKFCCLKKPKEALDSIESPEERVKWLASYPYTGQERVEGRIYLTDYFNPSGIEIDKILYLALMNRPGLIWNRNVEEEERRKREYLYLAFQKCTEKMEEEKIQSCAEYDNKYSIHYQCADWMGELYRLLKESNDTERCEEVRKFIADRQRKKQD